MIDEQNTRIAGAAQAAMDAMLDYLKEEWPSAMGSKERMAEVMSAATEFAAIAIRSAKISPVFFTSTLLEAMGKETMQ